MAGIALPDSMSILESAEERDELKDGSRSRDNGEHGCQQHAGCLLDLPGGRRQRVARNVPGLRAVAGCAAVSGRPRLFFGADPENSSCLATHL
ncbi:hypothetical protein Bphy_6379 (plasmid) [Paraburkholderia phymatum STM815]|uniref:Uncharacterized protein n=1 Tax=Paraburkholderia phymatum (strain DSM 17167 / CIP 108236 / LMG 21445 / STM815) TaxID=391038 RepID=B2JWT3_PARP8|nr:hypothetical protein Bphy_6379 [Paraburkholderia phymatum STM815]